MRHLPARRFVVALLVTLVLPAAPARADDWTDGVVVKAANRDVEGHWLGNLYLFDDSDDVQVAGTPDNEVTASADLTSAITNWYVGEDLVGSYGGRLVLQVVSGALVAPPSSVTSIGVTVVLGYTNPAGDPATVTIDAPISTHRDVIRRDATVTVDSSTAPDPSACTVATYRGGMYRHTDIHDAYPARVLIPTACVEAATDVTVDLAATVSAAGGAATDTFEPFEVGPIESAAARVHVSFGPVHGPDAYSTFRKIEMRYQPAADSVVTKLWLKRLYAARDPRHQVLTFAESYNSDPAKVWVDGVRKENVPAQVTIRKHGQAPLLDTFGSCSGGGVARSGRRVTLTLPTSCYVNQGVVPQWVTVDTIRHGERQAPRYPNPTGIVAIY